MAARPTKSAAKPSKPARPVFSIENARLSCPDTALAEKVAQTFGLNLPDFDAICEVHKKGLTQAWISFDEALNEIALKMHFQRIVGTYVASAQSAGSFYSEKVTQARDLTSKLANDDRDEDRDAPAGFESRAERARQFAADLAMQAYALLAAAEGAIEAYAEITGEDWKAFARPAEGPSVERKSAAAELAAFGG